jgi:threonine dehydrogenase-like Zn-dependent dehydrogenase
MKAIVRRSGSTELAEVAAPVGEAIIDVAYAGVCRTDLAVADGAIAVAEGRVLGHELSGWLDGEPVTVVPFAPCGECGECVAIGEGGAAAAASAARGRCESPRWLGVDRDGAFAERVAVPRASVIRLPRDLPLALGAFVEPVAAALGVLAVVERGMRVVIGGENRIAELTARVIAAAGAMRVSHGPCDVAIEHDGNAAALLPHLRAGGTLILKSRAARAIELPAGELVRRELIVRGASHGSFAAAVDWLHARRIAVADLLAPPRPLADFARVFGEARHETAKQMFAIAEHP